MKKILLSVVLLVLLAVPVFAASGSNDIISGVKFDAPNLVQLTENTTLGVEASKDLWFAEGHGWKSLDGNDGWTGYLKVTYSGTLFSLNQKGK